MVLTCMVVVPEWVSPGCGFCWNGSHLVVVPVGMILFPQDIHLILEALNLLPQTSLQHKKNIINKKKVSEILHQNVIQKESF